MNSLIPTIACAALAAALTTSASAQSILYVNGSLTTGANDGSSWADAHRGPDALTVALGSASGSAKVFVAQGTYLPSSTLDATASFEIRGSVTVYGGFVGDEPTEFFRPARGLAPTILSGDLVQNDQGGFAFRAENSAHVVRTIGSPGRSALDGLTITGGHAFDPMGILEQSGGAILCENGTTVSNCEFVDNYAQSAGAAIFNESGSLIVEDCEFTSNLASAIIPGFQTEGGGAIYHRHGPAVVRRSRFYFNRTSGRAGAVWLGSNGNISNSVFFGNRGDTGSAIWLDAPAGGPAQIVACTLSENLVAIPSSYAIDGPSGTTTAHVRQSVLWGNRTLGGGLVANLNPALLAEDSIVEDGVAGPGIIDADPLFIDQVAGALGLQSGSPAIDVSSITLLPVDAALADAGLRRRSVDDPMASNAGPGGGALDLGAIERSDSLTGVTTICPTIPNSTGAKGKVDGYGSTSVTTNALALTASDLPQNSFAFFIMSRTSAFIQQPGGSTGNLCLGGNITRLSEPGQIKNSGSLGTISVTPDLTAIPTPFGLEAGEAGDTWYFQAWHRDSVQGQPAPNFTSAGSVLLTL